jgi:hypothetical protein
MTIRVGTVLNYVSELISELQVKQVPAPQSGQTVTGYGRSIPSTFMVRGCVGDQWRRVYYTCFGNSSSFWIKVCGERFYFHDTDFNTFNPTDKQIQTITL